MALHVTLIYCFLCATLLEPFSGFITQRIYQTGNNSNQTTTLSNILPISPPAKSRSAHSAGPQKQNSVSNSQFVSPNEINAIAESQEVNSHPTSERKSNGLTDTRNSQETNNDLNAGTLHDSSDAIKEAQKRDFDPSLKLSLDLVLNGSADATKSQGHNSNNRRDLDYDGLKNITQTKPNPDLEPDFSPDGFAQDTLSPCHYVAEKSYVNCSSRNITVINPKWFPPNTLNITLDNNNINTLDNDTFRHLKSLRKLNISSSNVSTIEVNALIGLTSLETLDLENNNLPPNRSNNPSFPRGLFNNMTSLLHLFIAYNNIETKNVIYSASITSFEDSIYPYPNYIDIFDSLPNLQTLSIDTFSVLYLGPEFEKLPNLKRLVLFGADTREVRNDSFEGLANVTLKHLELIEFVHKDIDFHVDAFQHVTHLDSLTVYQCHIGNDNIMKTLWPFEHHKLNALTLQGTDYPHNYRSPLTMFEDGIIYKNTTKHLRNMCISYFAWRDSQLYAIEPGALDSPNLMQCVVTFDFSSNPLGLTGFKSLIYVAFRFKRLKHIVSLMPHIPHEHPNSKDQLQRSSFSYQDLYSVLTSEHFNDDGKVNEMRHKYHANSSPSFDDIPKSAVDDYFNISIVNDFTSKGNLSSDSVPHNGDININNYIHFSERKQKDNLTHTSQPQMSMILPVITIRLPPQLESIEIDNYGEYHFLHMIHTIYIPNGQNFRKISARNMPVFMYGSSRLVGLNNLQVADLTGTFFDVADYFADDFPGLENLTLSAVKPDSFFKQRPLKRLLRNLTKLKHLDISNNGLNFLSHGTFTTTPNLIYLSLAKNRFSNIPFDLSTTPNLRVLDLTENAIRFITDTEMEAIDAHLADGKSFTLQLEGNSIICVCSRIRFLGWQQNTLVHFDNEGNYPCTTEDGQVAFTKDFRNIHGFYRQCQGEFMLMVSLVLASLLAVAMLTAYLTARFRTVMVAYFLRIFAPHFRPMTISDYKTAVFVGYADDDYRFVRYVLQKYLEEGLKLSTFIHQRDLGAGYQDQQFYEAIQNSWRILLVITDNFLHNYDMAYNVMKYASYSVSPVNCERVLVLVEEAQLHNIPDFLYDVLEDTKIIPLPDIDAPLDYHHRQAIKNWALPR